VTRAKPKLEVVRQGNPGHQTKAKLERGVRLPPGAPAEPRWAEIFGPPRGRDPGAVRLRAEAERCRKMAREEWRAVVPVLDAMGLLATVDLAVLRDWCILVARLDQAERDISRRGLILEETGRRNPATMAAQGMRQRMGRIEAQLGLTPLARDQMRGDTRAASPDGPTTVPSPWDV
jgi:P27 family predicted phage terminase small subunit